MGVARMIWLARQVHGWPQQTWAILIAGLQRRLPTFDHPSQAQHSRFRRSAVTKSLDCGRAVPTAWSSSGGATSLQSSDALFHRVRVHSVLFSAMPYPRYTRPRGLPWACTRLPPGCHGYFLVLVPLLVVTPRRTRLTRPMQRAPRNQKAKACQRRKRIARLACVRASCVWGLRR